MIKLTPREKQVFNLILQRKSMDEIGDALGIQFTTVQFHLTAILKKYGVKSRAELVTLIEGPKTLDTSPRENSLFLPRGNGV